jgi:hypothetical protein
MNEEMANVEVLAVEVKQFERTDGQGNKAIVPRVVGLTESARSVKGSRRQKWTENRFFEAVESESVVRIIRDLYEWSQRAADRTVFGTGAFTGSFTFHYRREGKTVSVFSVYTDGIFGLNFGYLKDQIKEETLKQFYMRILKIESLAHLPEDFTKYPEMPVVEAFANSEQLQNFKDAVEWLKSQLV